MFLKALLIAFVLISDSAASAPDASSDIWASRTLENFREYSPELRSRPVPDFPSHLARHKIGGQVYVIYSYNENGDVTSTRLGRTSGNKQIDKIALKAVKSWKFFPMLIDGKPVAGEGAVPITFVPPK